MNIKSLLIAVPLCLALGATAFAGSAKHKRHVRPAPPAERPFSMLNLLNDDRAPAHMVEVRPGLWISSYGCVTDEGYGRYSSCDRTRIGR